MLRFDIPEFQPQAADDVHRVQRSGFGLGQFRDFFEDFRQPVKWNAVVQVMDVMIADVGREPSHDRAGFQIAGRFQRGFLVSPAGAVVKGNAGEIVLRVKQIRPDGAARQSAERCSVSNSAGQPKNQVSNTAKLKVHHRGDQAILMFARLVEKRINAHAPEKHEHIAEQDGQRMAHEQIGNPLALR